MTQQAPPTPLAAGNYQKGALIGLGKTASWDWPYVRLLQNWTCTSYQITNQYNGQQETVLTTPIEGQEAEYYWPEWKPNIDYSNQSIKPWGVWRVIHNNLYYEPTFWLSSAQTGKPPSTAEAQVGDYINKDLDGGQMATPKTRVKNQSHPIRVWQCLGTLEENNGWNTAFGSYNYNAETGERAHDFAPVFLNETIYDPNKIGGDAVGYYSEQYFPNMLTGREFVIDPENSKDGSTRVKPFTGTKDVQEPVFWDYATGAMPTKDIACGSPYVRYSGSQPGAMINYGISVNLWYQKVIFRQYQVKNTTAAQPAGVNISIETRYADSVENSLASENKVHLVDLQPGSGFGFDYSQSNWFFWGSGAGQVYYSQKPGSYTSSQSGVPPNYTYKASATMGVYGDTNHPLVLTRKKEYYLGTEKYTISYRWYYPPEATPSNPPSRIKVLDNITWSNSYEVRSVQMGENQLTYPGTDKDGKNPWENQANQLGSFVVTSVNAETELSYMDLDTNLYSWEGKWADD
jgi:hypothetical protein